MSFKWLARLTQQHSQNENQDSSADINRAIAVLMLEIAQSDFSETAEETRAVMAGLLAHTEQSEKDAEDLLTAARSDRANSAGLYEFTRIACKEMSMEERCHFVTQLWQIAFADGVIDKYEEAAIRKMSELLYVPHSEFIRAKLAAKAAKATS